MMTKHRLARLTRIVSLLEIMPQATRSELAAAIGVSERQLGSDLQIGRRGDVGILTMIPSNGCAGYKATHYGRYLAALPVVPTFDTSS
jgi:hypothetical protein